MNKVNPKIGKIQVEKVTAIPLNIICIIILLAYGAITVITPNLQTINSNGPKFLALSLLNLITFFFLLSKKEIRSNSEFQISFFSNKLGIAYSLFMGIILVSFAKAINIPESILSFTKYFTVFSAAYVISILLRFDKRYFKILVNVMVMFLVWDCIIVFYGIFRYISEQISTISEIQSGYSNKNILAAAIFVKIPFALWLATFEKGWLKKLGFLTIFMAVLAIFFMSTRAFYLGITFLSVVYCIYLLILSRRKKVNDYFKVLVYFIGIILLSFIIYSITQHYLYPRKADTYNVSVAQRFETISANESSSGARLESWKRSTIILRENPLLGVGIGNWKILNIKFENQSKSDFVFMYDSHNDFIQIATETGLFGGLLYILLFIFLWLNFLKAFFRERLSESSSNYLFLPAFGIFCYSIDAFFNFPAERAEMQSLFALFIGSGIAFSSFSTQEVEFSSAWKKKLQIIILIIFSIASSYILYMNFNSLRLQRIFSDDLLDGKLDQKSDFFITSFPSIPNLTNSGPEPIAVIKARYLINEKKYKTAINILRFDNSCPFSVSREHYTAMAYSQMGNYDSALLYSYKAIAIKPRHFDIIDFICTVLKQKGQKDEALTLLTNFIKLDKTNSKAWMDLTTLYWETGKYQNAIQSIDSAVKQLPLDSILLNTKIKLHNDIRIVPNQKAYSTAMDCLGKQKYPEALKYLNEFISKETGVAIVYAGRAYCYYYSKEFTKCIKDVDRSIALGNSTPDLINLRGLCFNVLGKMDAACNDFKNAAANGDKDAANNMLRFCKEK